MIVTKNNENIIDYAILLAMTLVCAVMSGYLLRENPNLGIDAIGYLLPWHNLMAGKGFTVFGKPELSYSPGYGLVAYFVYFVCNDVVLSGMLVSFLSTLGIIWATYFLTKNIFGRKPALLASFFTVISPHLLNYSYVTLTEALYCLVLLISMNLAFCIVRGQSTLKHFILLGMHTGFLFLVRPAGFQIGILVLTALPVINLFDHWREHWNRRQLLQDIYKHSAAIMMFIIMTSPYLLFQYSKTGQFSLSRRYSAVLMIYGEGVVDGWDSKTMRERRENFAERDKKQSLLSYILRDVKKFAKRIAYNLLNEYLYVGSILFHTLAPFALLWIFFPLISESKGLLINYRLRWPDKHHIRIGLIWLFFISPFASLLIFYVNDRFLLPYSMLLIPLVSAAIVRLVNVLSPGHARKILVAVCLVSLFCVSSPAYLLTSKYNSLIPKPESLANVFSNQNITTSMVWAGHWLKNNTEETNDLFIMAPRKAVVVLFLALGQDAALPGVSRAVLHEQKPAEVSEMMAEHKNSYLVLDRLHTQDYPSMWKLWENPSLGKPYGLHLVHESLAQGFKIFKYRHPITPPAG